AAVGTRVPCDAPGTRWQKPDASAPDPTHSNAVLWYGHTDCVSRPVEVSPMKTTFVSRLALILVVAAGSLAAAKPGNKPDCSASLPAVQTAVEAAPCDCATAVNHGQFVRCAAGVVKRLSVARPPPHHCHSPIAPP